MASVRAQTIQPVKASTPSLVVDKPQNTAPETPAPPKEPEAKNTLLHRLIAFEGEVIQAPDRRALKHIAVNKARILLPMGHGFLCTRLGASFKIEAVSNQAVINNQSPFIQWLSHILKSTAKAKNPEQNFSKPFDFSLQSRRDDDDFDYPYAFAYWAPFSPNPDHGGMLFTRDKPWDDSEKPVLDRIGQIVGISWAAGAKAKRKPATVRRKTVVGSLAVLMLVGLAIPVPVSTMAPAEIIAKDPFIVTAPMDGVIDKIHVKPGTMVKKGTLLATLNDTTYRNEYTLSGEEKTLATARYR